VTGPARRGPRPLLLACAGLALAAALLWAASAVRWLRVLPAGRAPVDLDGAALHPALTGVALLALAGVAGVVAAVGVLRRVVGVVLALAGGAVGATVLAGVPGGRALPDGVPADAPAAATGAPALALLGAAALLLVGVLVAVREPLLPRPGSRWAAPGPRRAASRPEADPDRAAWDALDAGEDPTIDPTRDRGHGPRDGTGA
jgi:hypothetical protein